MKATAVVVAALLAVLARGFVDVDITVQVEDPVCLPVEEGDLPFCSMVGGYSAVVERNDTMGLQADAQAQTMWRAVERQLQKFDCSQLYGFYRCDDCREAYKYWACATKFPRCSDSGATAECKDAGDCDGSRWRMCLSLCEDVVRKCPYVLAFSCPLAATRDFGVELDTCNKLNRTYIDASLGLGKQKWPATFGSAESSARVSRALLAAVVAAALLLLQ